MTVNVTVVSCEISIVVPVYNEAENIQPLAKQIDEALGKAGRVYELVFVDDGSSDETWDRITQLCNQNARVRGIRHAKNCGQSAALWTGLRRTTAPIVVTLDGDLQNDPGDLPLMLAELKDVEFVCGVRTERQDHWIRRVSSSVARYARRAVFGVDFRDTGCAFRVFKRTVLESVVPFDGLHRFFPILVHGGGHTTREIAIRHRPRIAGRSKYGVWNRLGRGIFDLIGMSWYQKRRLRPVASTECTGALPGHRSDWAQRNSSQL